MAHVGVECLGPGHAQHDGAEHGEPMEAVLPEKSERVSRVDCRQHDRLSDDPADAEHGDGDEPEHHDRTEQAADAVGAVFLNGKDNDQDGHGDRHHIGLE